jgi:hypothetical protein
MIHKNMMLEAAINAADLPVAIVAQLAKRSKKFFFLVMTLV